MNNNTIYLTPEGLKKLQAELEKLKIKRVSVVETVSSTRELGDLRENADFQSARDDQMNLDARIYEIEDILKRTAIIDKKKSLASGCIDIGSTVHLQDVQTSEVKVFEIVDSVEANPFENKISTKSVVGQSLFGKKIGEQVILPKVDGQATYKILKIN